MTSAAAADMLAAELDDHADDVERAAAEAGQSRVTAARVRSLRRAARQLRDLHGTEDGA